MIAKRERVLGRLTSRTRRHLAAMTLLSVTIVSPGFGEESVESRLDEIAESLFALGMTPGMAVAVVSGDQVVYSRGFGVADIDTGRLVSTDTLFYIASTTKSFTAMAVALLDHEGVMELDAPVTRYLPTLELAAPLVAAEITLRDLLTMTHGIEGGGPVVFRTAYSGEHSPAQLIELLGDYKPSETGRTFSYGNLGYNIAGLAIDAALHESWKEVLARQVFAPLGMVDTSAYRSRVEPERLAMPHAPTPEGFRRLPYTKNDDNMHAAGGHVTTVDDLAKWLEVHLNEGRLDGKQVFPAEVVAATHARQAEQDRDFGLYHRHGWGLGWDLGTYDGDLLIHRFGTYAGFRPHLSFMPEHGLGVVVLVNDGALGGMLVDIVANAIYDELLGKTGTAEKRAALEEQTAQRVAMGRQMLAKDLERRAARSQDLPFPLAAYAGAYDNPAIGRLEWRLVADRLEVWYGLVHSEAEVYDAEANKLRVELTGRGEVIEFTPGAERMQSLTYNGFVFERADR